MRSDQNMLSLGVTHILGDFQEAAGNACSMILKKKKIRVKNMDLEDIIIGVTNYSIGLVASLKWGSSMRNEN